MKRSFLLLASIFLFFACEESNDKNKDNRILTDSSGNINQLTVVIDKSMWEGEVGEAIRTEFAAPVDGLPQEEPLFSLSQIPPETFTGFVRNSRIFLKVEQGKPGMAVVSDEFSRPQKGIVVQGENNRDIVRIIEKRSDSIIQLLKGTELAEKQRRIRKSLSDDVALKEKFGIDLRFPSAYRYAKDEEKFSWIRKEIPKGSMEILIYEVPMSSIDNDSSVVSNIIKMRDSIGEAMIPGRLENSFMITEKAYAPYLFESKIDGKFAYETRGTWEVQNDFMAGPFINYAIKDEQNNRYLILEGFVFSPSRAKRDNIFELDAILQSVKVN